MEEEEEGGEFRPFWLQSSGNNSNFCRTSRLGSRVTTVVTQLLLAGATVILLVFFVFSIASSISQISRYQLLCKSWNNLNYIIDLFSFICGLLSRNTDGYDYNNGGYKWYSSSYPDLRLREFEDDESWGFYDDSNVNERRYEASERVYSNQDDRDVFQEVTPPENADGTGDGGGYEGGGGKCCISDSDAEKVEVVEEQSAPSNSPPPSLSPTCAPPPSKPAKRVDQHVTRKEEKKERDYFAAVTPSMTPIPPPTTVYQKKKGRASKNFLTALWRKKKKKLKQRVDGLDLLFGSDRLSVYLNRQKPPPFFRGLFWSKKGKNKMTYSNPPERSFKSRASVAKIRKATVESNKPNAPAKVTQFTNTGSESPLMPDPLPPPPPPFKMPDWKYVMRGDYVRMASDISICSDELDDPDVSLSPDRNATSSPLCPSPDVDKKANDFIARFRAGLKLEKMSSVTSGDPI